MKTEAAVLWELHGDWKVQEVELGEPVEGEVRVRLAASGVCHTDDHIVTGDLIQPLPAIGGHEGAGVVEAVGPGVPGLAPGDHVVLVYIPSCGTCESCSKGRANLCDRGGNRREGRALADGTCRFTADGVDVTTICLLGTFARHTVVHHSQVLKIENDIPLVQAALVGCGVTAGFGAAVNTAEIRAGEIVVVVGVGGLGAAGIQGARIAGARYIVAIEPSVEKHQWARDFGATHTVTSFAEAENLVREISWGRMADVALLTTDLAKGEYLGPTLALVGKHGRVAVVAVAPAGQKSADLSLADLTFYEKQIRGALYGSASPRAGITRVLDLYRTGDLKLDEMITRTYRLAEINQAFADMKNGRNIRGVVVYED